MKTALWTAGVYLVVGVLTSFLLSQTPYRDNGYLWITLLWPLYWYAILQ